MLHVFQAMTWTVIKWMLLCMGFPHGMFVFCDHIFKTAKSATRSTVQDTVGVQLSLNKMQTNAMFQQWNIPWQKLTFNHKHSSRHKSLLCKIMEKLFQKEQREKEIKKLEHVQRIFCIKVESSSYLMVILNSKLPFHITQFACNDTTINTNTSTKTQWHKDCMVPT